MNRVWLVCLLLTGCAAAPAPEAYTTSAELREQLDADLRTLGAVRAHLDVLDDEYVHLHQQGGWAQRGYFSVEENDTLERLLFRSVTSHAALWDVSAHYQDMQTAFDQPELDARAHVVSRHASLLLADHSAWLVAEFARDPVAIDKLNEAFPRSEIPRDTYSHLARSITAKRLSRIEQAAALASAELADPDSALARLAASDARYAQLMADDVELQGVAEADMHRALEQVGHTTPEPVRATEEFFGDGLYGARAMLFKDVSRLKKPNAEVVRFSADQKAQVLARLRPGDLIMTYTAGYMSDVFIPGAFKHGITFVGSPEQRAQAGLGPGELPAVAPDARGRMDARVEQASLADGRPADVIEAVAEGVIFNHLGTIMDTHVNRLLILRPQLTEGERTAFLTEVFSYLGEDYDFCFDFADSTRQVCTEVIYRALDGKSGIAFELTVRGGHETLSADDIALYYLNQHPQAFQLVLYAEEDPDGSDRAARLLTGAAGVERLRELMSSVGE